MSREAERGPNVFVLAPVDAQFLSRCREVGLAVACGALCVSAAFRVQPSTRVDVS